MNKGSLRPHIIASEITGNRILTLIQGGLLPPGKRLSLEAPEEERLKGQSLFFA